MVWPWKVIVCVNELGHLNSCCFGMRARFCICRPVGRVGGRKVAKNASLQSTNAVVKNEFKKKKTANFYHAQFIKQQDSH